MGFLAPGFLAGLLALGLPLWLHLLRQHRSTPRPFSSLMFFERRTQSSIKHRRLRYLLLLAARLALLALIVLAFASPYIRRGAPPPASGRKLLLIAVDNSFSMRQGDRLARAKDRAASLLGRRTGTQSAQVVAVGSRIQVLTQPTADPGELRAAAGAIRPSDARSSYGELARFLRTLAQSSRTPVEAHFITDMQKTSLPPGFADLRLGAGTSLELHSVAARAEPNFAVESVTAPRVVYDPKKARVLATVAGFGTEAATRTVSLVVNGKTLSTKTAGVPKNGRASVEFLALDAAYGFQRAEVRIDSADTLPGDDRFVFAVERSDPRRILFVHEARGARAVTYFRAALDADTDSAFTLDTATTEQSANLDPAKYAFVVLSDVAFLPGGFEQALTRWVRGGGAVLIAVGPAMAARPRVPVFDEAMGESRYASRAGERFQSAGSVDATHPAIGAAARWDAVKFYQTFRVNQGNGRVIARLADESPLLVEKTVGEGRVLLFASTFDNISNDLPLRAVFVPFAQQTAHYLAGSETRPPSYTVGMYVDLRADKRLASAVEVLDPSGKRALSLKEAATAESIPLTETGYYDVRRSNGRHELVAVNTDRQESDLGLIPEETLALWRNTGEGSAGDAAAAAGAAERNWGVWWYVLLAALATAAAESLVAARYLNVEKETA